jgi:hypothetical protein
MVSRRSLIVAAGVGALAFAATSFLYPRGGNVAIDFERGYEEAFVEGFHPRERSEGRYLRWTDEESAVELRHLPTRGTIECELRLRTLRPRGEALPMLAFTANGVTLLRTPARPGVSEYRFELPATSSRLRLGIESDTFSAPGSDRLLGVQVLAVRLDLPDHLPSFEGAALWMSAAALLLLAAGVVCRIPFPVAVLAALGLTGGFVYLLSLRGLRFSSYPQEVALLAAAVLAAAFLQQALLTRLRWLHSSERSIATALLSLLLLLKMGALFYPLMVSSDAAFQANRMIHFLEGNWHPTSVTQHDPPFEIPYPVALFAVAAPLAKAGVALVPALEITTGLTDVLVSALLMFLGWRCLDDFRAGAVAGILYQLVPLNALSFSAGNFTNLFALSMLACAFTCLAANAVAGTGGATLLALTAHFGMLLEGVILWPLWIVLSWVAPKPVKDRRAVLTGAVLAAFVVAGIYYLGYWELVTGQVPRALSESAAGGAGGGGSGLALLGEQLTWVFLATSFLGCLAFVREPLAGSFSALAFGWLASTLVFFSVDLWTGLEIRYWLQALPLLALFSGAYLSRAFNRGTLGKVAAAAALAYVGFVGMRTLVECMVYRYH